MSNNIFNQMLTIYDYENGKHILHSIGEESIETVIDKTSRWPNMLKQRYSPATIITNGVSGGIYDNTTSVPEGLIHQEQQASG